MEKVGSAGYDETAQACDRAQGAAKPYFAAPQEKWARIVEAGVTGQAEQCSPQVDAGPVKEVAKLMVLDVIAWREKNKKPDLALGSAPALKNSTL